MPTVFRHATDQSLALVPRRLRPAGQALALMLWLGLSALAGGFLIFAERVADTHAPAAPHADGIVALTGGAERIGDAVDLLENGSAARLLISGVHERTTGDALAQQNPQLAPMLGCCVDIGRDARDTRGNALEARDWARRRGYDSLIVVTSAFHMPRSLAEIGRELPNVTLVPYPVNPDERDYAAWPRDPETFRLLLVEYSKYIVAQLG